MNVAVRRIARASCALDGMYWLIAKNSGIKENLFWLLYALDDEEIHTQKQICDDWLFPRTTINTLIKECESNGLITLEPLPGRGRERRICLTEAGRAYQEKSLAQMKRIEKAALAQTLKNHPPEFADAFLYFASQLQTAAESILSKKDDA